MVSARLTRLVPVLVFGFMVYLTGSRPVCAEVIADSNVHLPPLQGDPEHWISFQSKTLAEDPERIFTGLMAFSVDSTERDGNVALTMLSLDAGIGSDWYLGVPDQLFSTSSIAAGAHPFWGPKRFPLLVPK